MMKGLPQTLDATDFYVNILIECVMQNGGVIARLHFFFLFFSSECRQPIVRSCNLALINKRCQRYCEVTNGI
ncbi:Uncharacterized protein APZ42_013025 [Daphnia magna]|uniref:Uncharacterized protein n=1 Tax=Daphnia magna TaxID=35525 RepID=A0A162R923_9CRUS|nr:Uncharacterized protein APZ42_013025 [Daphnia magna]